MSSALTQLFCIRCVFIWLIWVPRRCIDKILCVLVSITHLFATSALTRRYHPSTCSLVLATWGHTPWCSTPKTLLVPWRNGTHIALMSVSCHNWILSLLKRISELLVSYHDRIQSLTWGSSGAPSVDNPRGVPLFGTRSTNSRGTHTIPRLHTGTTHLPPHQPPHSHSTHRPHTLLSDIPRKHASCDPR